VTEAPAIDWDALERAATAARARAHAPYSHYTVGAALLAEDGRVFTGANIENASYPLSLCAERSAISCALDGGAKRFAALVVATGGARAAAPCGACRQVLAEFPPSFPVRCVSDGGGRIDTSVSELLPHPFGSGYLDGQ
jgi:cytidine deaminase